MTVKLPPRSFCLIRHGETTANRDAIIAGRLEVALTDNGRNQARALHNLQWPPEVALFSSPMQRARETCTLGFHNQPYQIHLDLRERDWGIFEGKPLHLMPPRNGCPPKGEDWQAMITRVGAAITECCARAGSQLPVIICHSGVIRATRILAGQSSSGHRPANAAPLHFIWQGNSHHETPHEDSLHDT